MVDGSREFDSSAGKPSGVWSRWVDRSGSLASVGSKRTYVGKLGSGRTNSRKSTPSTSSIVKNHSFSSEKSS